MKIAIILGTRPEIIKMSPVIRLFDDRDVDYCLIHSNQHYSKNMDEIFFKELNLTLPDYNLKIGSANHGNQTGRMLVAIEEILLKEKPDFVLSQGDTNTVLAAIIAGSKLNIRCGHVEAGLRSYDRRMPEEKNRVICDVISDFLFAPTDVQKEILISEGILKENIFVVGNTIVDAVYQNKEISKNKSNIIKKLNLKKNEYILFTAHRSLNVDRKESLICLIKIIKKLKEITNKKIVYPIHPRTKAKLDSFGLSINNCVLIEPVGYLDFLNLEMNASLIVTDSGGVQEEACILKIPCITIRENTERPETINVGANKLIGLDADKLKDAIDFFKTKKFNYENPFGDGTTSEKILEVLKSQK